MVAFIILILMLGVLIFLHEFGHYITAKKCGAYVYEFAIGMGPKLFSFKRKNKNDPTVYSLRLFPIGGFCAIAGEVMEDDSGDDTLVIPKEQYMCNMKIWQRCVILIAGVTMNFLTGLVLLFISGLIWGSTNQVSIIGSTPVSFMDGETEVMYPVHASGIEEGDRILEINGKRVNTWDRVTLLLNVKHDSDTYTFKVEKKDGSIKTYDVKPIIKTDEKGNNTKIFGMGQSPERNYGILASIKYSFFKSGSIIRSMVDILGNLFTGKLSLNSLSGPIGVYSVTKQASEQSAESVIYLAAYLALNLGFMNILPFPAFDGGRVLFLIIEKLRKKKMNPKVENTINTIGFMILVGLMIIISIKDIFNLF